MNFFIKLAQAHDTFIINLVQAIKLNQVVFNEMLEHMHDTILMKWITNFNGGIDFLAFKCQTNHIWAKAHDSNMDEILCDQELFLPSCGRCHISMFSNKFKIMG
jgi:hypothetical protein